MLWRNAEWEVLFPRQRPETASHGQPLLPLRARAALSGVGDLWLLAMVAFQVQTQGQLQPARALGQPQFADHAAPSYLGVHVAFECL